MDNNTANDDTAQEQGISPQGIAQPDPGFRLPDPPESDANGEECNEQERQTQKEMLLAAAESAELWHNAEGEAFASLEQEGRRENCLVRSRTFRGELCLQVYKKYNCVPSSQSMEDALRVLEAKAKFDGAEYETYVRISGDMETSYLHLADKAGTIIKIGTEGVSDASTTSIKFLSKPGLKPLPMPVMSMHLNTARTILLGGLRNFCNIKDDGEWLLFLVALLSAFRSKGPFVVVMVVGEQGAAKSTLCKIFRRLVDPSKAPLRSAPREERDLWIAANNGWIIIFDNVSYLKHDLSDAICRLSTGGGNSYRTLYENDQETLFQATRLVLLNTIDELPLRGDVVDRAIRLVCTKIDETARRTEEEFWQSFKEQEAEILGALLQILSEALRHLPSVELEKSPRMADFARFGIAVEKALGLYEGTFLDAYQHNRDSMVSIALENQFADEITKLTLPVKETPTDLWEKLRTKLDYDASRLPKWFPVNPQQLSSQLRRLAPFLRKRGREVSFSKSGKRLIVINAIEEEGLAKEAPNASNAPKAGQEPSPEADA